MEKPLLKWVGGKSQIIDDVMALFPAQMTNYHEPFVGGGSVLLALLSHRKAGKIAVAGTIFASDLNPNLIALYKNVQTQPQVLIESLRLLMTGFSQATVGPTATVNRGAATADEAKTSQESYYFWIRKRFNAMSAADRNTCWGSAMLLFLNKTCFRGLYREGPNGFNVPFGNYKSPQILNEAHILAVSDLIQGVVFTERGFTESLEGVATGDFVYMDPPYAQESATSFVGYTAAGFSPETHSTLFAAAAGLQARGARMLLSNADVPVVRQAFPAPAFETKIISCRRAINSTSPGARTNEVLIRR
jgi:DNA adenine methylase